MSSALHTQQQWTFGESTYPPQSSGGAGAAAIDQRPQPFGPAQRFDQAERFDPIGVVSRPASSAQRPRMDQGRFWVGAVLTAVVAGLAAVIGLVVAQDLLRVPLSLGAIGLPGAHVGSYGLLVAVVALLAAVAFNGMMAFAPRPTVYYGTLAGLLTALAVLSCASSPQPVLYWLHNWPWRPSTW